MQKLLLNARECDIYPERNDDRVIKLYSVSDPRFSMGDFVSIKPGFVYAYYRAAAIACGIITFEENRRIKRYIGSPGNCFKGEIIGMCRHENEKRNLYAVKLEDDKKVLVSEEGIIFLKKASYLGEDLFEL